MFITLRDIVTTTQRGQGTIYCNETPVAYVDEYRGEVTYTAMPDQQQDPIDMTVKTLNILIKDHSDCDSLDRWVLDKLDQHFVKQILNLGDQ